MKSADFDDRHIAPIGRQSLVQLFSKLLHYGLPRADLAPKEDVVALAPQGDSHLLPMKVNSEEQLRRFSW